NNRHFFSDFISLLIPNELRTHLYSLPTYKPSNIHLWKSFFYNILYMCVCSYGRAWLPVCHKYIPISLRNLWLVAYRVVKHDQSFSWCISSILSL
ncbi:unnamed protein product, partial [Brassica napus]